MIDRFREKPRETLAWFFPSRSGENTAAELPLWVRALLWIFLPKDSGRKRLIIKKAALRLLGVK
jgi:hypothetical protein